MDYSMVKRSKDLELALTQDTAEAIDALVDGISHQSDLVPFLMDEVHAAARSQSEEDEDWIRAYYLQGGWRADVRAA